MGKVMEKVKHYAMVEDVWPADGKWDGSKVATLYSKVWPHLQQYLVTKGKHGEKSKRKKRPEQRAWRSCYNDMCENGLFRGGKKRKAKKKANDEPPPQPQHKKRRQVYSV